MLGLIKFSTKTTKVIPAYSPVVSYARVPYPGKWALIEPPFDCSLPCGVLVTTCLIILPLMKSTHLPGVLRNQTGHDVILPPKAVLAQLSAVQLVHKPHPDPQSNCTQSEVSEPPTPQHSNLSFNLGNSPLSPEWKEIITKKLNSIPEYLSFLHNMTLTSDTLIKLSITSN